MSRVLESSFAAKDGAQVRIRLHCPTEKLRELRQAGRPLPEAVEIDALLDTGAECTCVAPHILERLGLDPVGVFPVNTPALGGLGGAITYAASLTILHPSGKRRQNLVIDDIKITELDLGALGYDALIGRDVLAKCVLTYNGPAGSFTLSY